MKSFGVLAFLAAMGIASSFRAWDCPLCGRPAVPVHCPACGDAGRVSSLTRVRRSRLDPRLRALFADPRDALGGLLGAEVDVDLLYSARARFAVCDGEDVVVVLLHQARRSTTARQRAEAWMFGLGGAPLDHLLVMGLTSRGGAAFSFIGPDLVLLTGADGHVTVWPEGGEASRRFRLAGGKFAPAPP